MKPTIFADNYALLLGKKNDLESKLLLNDFIHWKKKSFYLRLLEKFINEQIDGNTFRTKYWKLRRIHLVREYNSNQWLKKLERIEFTKVVGFSEITSKLFTACAVFEPDPDEKEIYEISEEEFREAAKAAFFKIKNDYP